MIGENILGYEICEKLGYGAFGIVYKAIKINASGRFVRALKHISIPSKKQYASVLNSMGGNISKTNSYFEEQLQNIVAEIQILNNLSEKGAQHIVRYYDNDIVTQESPRKYDVYILMEYLTPLEDYMENRDVLVRDIVKLGLDVLDGLRVCHDNGVIHRDVKDENIFVSTEGEFKIGDFGVSKVLKDSSKAESLKGTPNFLAPEVYLGQEAYTKSVDLYSLGIVLYRLLNYNRNPFLPHFPEQFYAEDENSAFEKRMRGETPNLPSLGGRKIGEVIVKAISVPDSRFKTAEDFIDALSAAASETEDKILAQKVKANVDKRKIFIPEEYGKTVAENVTKIEVQQGNETSRDIHRQLFESVNDGLSNKTKKKEEKVEMKNKSSKRVNRSIIKLIIWGFVVISIVSLIVLFFVKSNRSGELSELVDESENPLTDKCSIIAESNIISVGETAELAFEFGEYVYREDASLRWTSNNSSIVSVDDKGTITGLSEGEARITGIYNNYEAFIDITVQGQSTNDTVQNNTTDNTRSDILVNSLEILCPAPILLKGDSVDVRLKADDLLLNGDSESISWGIDDTAIASIDEKGKLTAYSVGTCQLTATYGGKTDSQQIIIVEEDANSEVQVTSDFEKLSLSIYGEDTINLTLSGNMPDQFSATAYCSSGMSLQLDWGELNSNSVPLKIKDLMSNEREGYITILVNDGEHTDRILASIKIDIRINE